MPPHNNLASISATRRRRRGRRSSVYRQFLSDHMDTTLFPLIVVTSPDESGQLRIKDVCCTIYHGV
jgi:hypothetical protein